MTVNSKQALLDKLQRTPEQVEFSEVIATIESHYHYHSAAFCNGDTHNAAGTNEGSAKIFAFALLNQLSKAQTLACFGKFYRHDVLEHPEGDDHQNIRNFMVTAWAGIDFESTALTEQ